MVAGSFDRTPEELHELRVNVESWLGKTREAVWSFRSLDDDFAGIFKRHSQDNENFTLSSTTTARCFMALVYAQRQIGEQNNFGFKNWRVGLHDCFNTMNLTSDGENIFENPDGEKNEADPKELNNFDIAHIVDLLFAQTFCKRFDENCDHDWPLFLDSISDESIVRDKLVALLGVRLKSKETHIQDGQLFFEENNPESRHFFVTLHTLRALSILNGADRFKNEIKDIVADAKRFCVDQCFYVHRNMRHQHDPARLVFASVIYCMYAEEVNRDIMLAIVEAIKSMQEPSGKWPSTRPIIRGDKKIGKTPWYISNPELGLSLTWLYFQPKLPDAARELVLDILESHFQNWIVPTFRQHGAFCGWYDDSSADHERVVGWTTAIVCHFLANYNEVLNDCINRKVIEALKLQDIAERYLIDEIAPQRNSKWGIFAEDGNPWPDLPETAWNAMKADPASITSDITWEWSDPSDHSLLSQKLSEYVICPILNGAGQRPSDYKSGILSGPPGTRKTSLVKNISSLLGWPYVPVPASVIFEDGFDSMESKSSEVFRRLNYLTQCVVFFDEFEEFFRSRSITQLIDKIEELYWDFRNTPNDDNERGESNENKLPKRTTSLAPTHDRTVAAFTTSAMLPRLQDLHDKGRSLVMLATNESEKLDSAIKRAGRFDFEERIDHPQLSRFVKGHLSKTYFGGVHCGWENLEKLKIATDPIKRTVKAGPSGEQRLTKIAKQLKEALKTKSAHDLIANLQSALSEQGSATSDDTKGNDMRIRFSIVESMTRFISSRLEDDELTKKTIEKLTHELEKISDSDEGAGSLPAPQLKKRET